MRTLRAKNLNRPPMPRPSVVRTLTKGELLARLADVPDDAPVYIVLGDGEHLNGIRNACGLGFRGEGIPSYGRINTQPREQQRTLQRRAEIAQRLAEAEARPAKIRKKSAGRG